MDLQQLGWAVNLTNAQKAVGYLNAAQVSLSIAARLAEPKKIKRIQRLIAEVEKLK